MNLPEPLVGVEPTTYWLQISCSTNWAKVAYWSKNWYHFIHPSTIRLQVRMLPVEANAAILNWGYRYSNFLNLLPKLSDKWIEIQLCKELSASFFLTLPFFEEGKGKRICVILKFWFVFFLLVFNELQNLSGNTVMPAACNAFSKTFSVKRRAQDTYTWSYGHKKNLPRGRFL